MIDASELNLIKSHVLHFHNTYAKQRVRYVQIDFGTLSRVHTIVPTRDYTRPRKLKTRLVDVGMEPVCRDSTRPR